MNSINNTKDLTNHQWMRQKLRTLCSVSQYCGLCLETTGNFYPMTTEFAINECYSTKPLRDVINAVFNCDIEDTTTSDMICEQCTEKTIHSYIFINNTRKMFVILNSLVTDLLSKANDLDRKMIKDHNYGDASVVIYVKYDTETYKNVNKMTSGYNTILSDKPILISDFILPDITPLLNIQPNISAKKQFQEKQEKVQGPIVVPILSKNPLCNDLDRKLIQEPKKADNSVVSLEGGKIVITPLTTSHSTTKFDTYKCNICQSVFTTYRYLKEHEKLLHNLNTYKCRFCNKKKYNSQHNLDVHYKDTHSKSRCRICQTLLDSNDLNKHLIENHPKMVYKCEQCDLAYYVSQKLEMHMNSAHSKKHFENSCILCFRVFTDLRMHKCKYTCLQCLEVPCIHYSYLMSYREQVLNHAVKVKCKDCDYTTPAKENLITHVNREHLNYHPFTCHDCGAQFYTKMTLKLHIIRFHLELKCQYCDQNFKTHVLLHNHKEICKNITRSFNCVLCVASFDTRCELIKHQKFCHSDIVYPCTLCKKKFLTPLELRQHHTRVHNVIPYKKGANSLHVPFNKKDSLHGESHQ